MAASIHSAVIVKCSQDADDDIKEELLVDSSIIKGGRETARECIVIEIDFSAWEEEE